MSADAEVTILNMRPRWRGSTTTGPGHHLDSITISGTGIDGMVTLDRKTLLALMAETARLLGGERRKA